MKKQDVISLFENSIGSMFAKEDIIRILNKLEEPKVEAKNSYPSKEWLDKIKSMVLEGIRDTDFNDTNMYDLSKFEFEIKFGNTIRLNSFEVDACALKVYVENEIENSFGAIEDDIIEIQQGNEEEERLNSNEALKEE
jgi:hypothetical protein